MKYVPRYSREQYGWRVLGYNGKGKRVTDITKGPWREKRDQAHHDVLYFIRYGFEHIKVQKVRLGITKILETEVIK